MTYPIITQASSSTSGSTYVGTVLYEETLSGSGIFDIENISQDYDDLEIMCYLRSNVAADDDQVYMYLNGDTTDANYYYQLINIKDNGSTYAEGAIPRIGNSTGASAYANEYSVLRFFIQDYTNIVRNTNIRASHGYRNDISTEYIREIQYNWNSTEAITSISIETDGNPTDLFIEGSSIKIIGYKRGSLPVIIGRETTLPSTVEGRLTLESGSPVSISDQTSGSEIYYEQYNGKYVALYDGANWRTQEFDQMILANSGFTASKPHDIFMDWNGGDPSLDKVVWTDGTTRDTEIVRQDGRWCLSGNLDWNYLGTIYVDSSGSFNDALQKRLLWNCYNRTVRKIGVEDSTTSWAYNTSTWRVMRGVATNIAEFIVGIEESPVDVIFMQRVVLSAGVSASISVGLDSTSIYATESDVMRFVSYHVGLDYDSGVAGYSGYPGIGYHYLAPLEYSGGATSTFYGGVLMLFAGRLLG